MPVTPQALSDIPGDLPYGHWDFLNKMKLAINIMLGREGTWLNQVVTYQDLIDLGLAKSVNNAPQRQVDHAQNFMFLGY